MSEIIYVKNDPEVRLEWRLHDVEAAIATAKREAARRGCSVRVHERHLDHIATVWPNGKVDVTWEGSRYA